MTNSTSTEKEKAIPAMTAFFWWCSGANTDILKNSLHSEQQKYVGIGATVFFTGLLASLSGGYALFSVFQQVLPAVAFGIVWGLVIFNLDRFIVSTLRKEDSFWSEFKLVLPRLVLAVILAIVISKPLELKIFEKEIAQKVAEKQRLFAIEAQRQTEKQFDPVADSLRNEIAYYKNEIAKVAAVRDTLYNAFIGEAEGTKGTFKLGKGPVYKEKKMQYDKIEQEMKELQAKYQPLIDERERQILQVKAQRDSAMAKAQPVISGYDGLMARLDGLAQLPQLPSYFIMLLFICLETAPVFAKLFAGKGPYDEQLRNLEHGIAHAAQEAIRERTFKGDMERRRYTETGEAQVTQDISTQLEKIRMMSEAELAITRQTVQDWMEQEQVQWKEREEGV